MNYWFLVIAVIAILLLFIIYYDFIFKSGSNNFKRKYLNKSNIFDEERLNEPVTRDETSMRKSRTDKSLFNIIGEENGDGSNSITVGGLYRKKIKKNKKKKSLNKNKYKKYRKYRK
jgi:hypothetical protein